ncbi:hypothetical protein ACFXP3_04485 [Streptomyces sp. NPDC059096]|uniref:hypothetical protein n=1 Tax=Streptomyces sp. NPDC059096 TaxID=3346727 RepID=UPI0036765835
MPMTSTVVDDLFTGLTPHQGVLERGDAYTALRRLLDHVRTVADRTTPTELWAVLQTLDGGAVFGSRDRLHQMLRTIEIDGAVRRTPTGHILLRLDAPSGGGPEHVWVRIPCRGVTGSEVEVTGADPWPDHQLHAPGPAWWRCTGCRTHSGIRAADFHQVREDATSHASGCRALPAPPATDG